MLNSNDRCGHCQKEYDKEEEGGVKMDKEILSIEATNIEFRKSEYGVYLNDENLEKLFPKSLIGEGRFRANVTIVVEKCESGIKVNNEFADNEDE